MASVVKRAVAPRKLVALDVDAERKRSAAQLKLPVEANDDAAKPAKSAETAVSTKKKAADDGAVTKKKKKQKSPGKVAIAPTKNDAFNDLSEASKKEASDRPASAQPAAKKPPVIAASRPGSAASPTKAVAKKSDKPTKSTTAWVTPASDDGPDKSDGSPRKTARNDSDASSPVQAVHADDSDREQPATGVHYDIFVQTRRCESVCVELGLTLKDVRKIKVKYDENDMYHSGEITQAEFFFIINEDDRPLTRGLLRLGNVQPDQKFLSFDEYLLCVASFASLTPPELYQFVFDLYDDDKSGSLDEHEFAKMSKELQSKQFSFPKNVANAIRMMEGLEPSAALRDRGFTGDGLVDLPEFMRFARLFPVAFFPILNVQRNVRIASLGERRWSNLVARKLKIQSLVSHMRRHYGATPELTWRERLWSLISDDEMEIRKRAAEIYASQLTQRSLIGSPVDKAGDAEDDDSD
ncbi:hypothetical protein ATCC90586_003948 [Pythium insidiosum]|nr:hypothetical protein ATCC90586_003948 [Pythium insidiosum]